MMAEGYVQSLENISCKAEGEGAMCYVLTQFHPVPASPLYVGIELGPRARFISDISQAHVFATEMMAIRAACNILELHDRIFSPEMVLGRMPTILPLKGRRCRSCQVTDAHPPLLLGLHGWAEADLCGECKNPLLMETWTLFGPSPERTHFMARRFVNGIPTLEIIEADSFESLNEHRGQKLLISRQSCDPPGVLGMWV